MKTVADVGYLNGSLVIKYDDNTVEMMKPGSCTARFNDPNNLIFKYVERYYRNVGNDQSVQSEQVAILQKVYKDFFANFSEYSAPTHTDLQELVGKLHLHLFP